MQKDYALLNASVSMGMDHAYLVILDLTLRKDNAYYDSNDRMIS